MDIVGCNRRRKLACKMGDLSPFAVCVGFVNGSLIPIAQRPGSELEDDLWCRHYNSALNVQVVVDIDEQIRHAEVGWTGLMNDYQVFDWSDISGLSSFAKGREVLKSC